MKHIKNICFEGGGVKGVGLCGAAIYLDEIGEWEGIERFAGSSAGAIFALMASLGYKPKEIKEIFYSVDFTKFRDDESYYRKCRNLLGKYGIYSGRYFEGFIKDLIQDKLKKEDATFIDMYNKGLKNLFIVTSNISTYFSNILSLSTTPNLELWKAVRMSMAIPFYFTQFKQETIITNDQGKEELKECWFSDGGVFNNYPIRLFDDPRFTYPDINGSYFNDQTIGFKLETKDKIDILLNKKYPRYHNIRNIVEYTERLINSLMNNQDDYFRSEDDWKRTIFIDTLGIQTTDFDINLQKKNLLIESGYKGAIKFFEEKYK